MSVPSIKSLIVEALTANRPLDHVHHAFMIDKFTKTFKPVGMRYMPRWNTPMNEVYAFFRQRGATDEQLAQWESEWGELVKSCQKRAKMRALNEVSIETILKAKLRGTGIKYQMRKQQYRVALTLSMSHNTQALFYIQHSKFREQLDKILPAVKMLNDLMDDLGQPIRMKTLENLQSGRWNEVEE